MRNLDKIFKIIAFLALLLLSVTSKAQVPLYQLEYAPDSNYVIGANPLGEPIWVHVDSLAIVDSIYLRGDSLILLKNGSGQVYKSRIYDFNSSFVYYYDIPNPQSGDIWVPDEYDPSEKAKYYNGSSWVTFDFDGYVGNEGELSLANITTLWNAVRVRSTGGGSGSEIIVVGDTLINVEYDGIVPRLRLSIDTTVLNTFAGETQYLNPYIITGDTVGFYITVAQDTVLFQNTIDTSSNCCAPSIGSDTLYIGDHYVVLPSGEATTVGDTPTINMTLTGVNITGEVIDGSITPAKLDRTYLTAEVDGSITNEIELPSQTGNSGKYLTTNGTTPLWGSVAGNNRLKLSSGDYSTSSTSVSEWTGSNFRDTIQSTGWHKIEVYANFTTAATTTGIAFDITAAGHGYASGFYSASINDAADVSVRTHKNVNFLGADPIITSGVSSTSEDHTLYANVTCYISSGNIVIPKFGSEVSGSTATFKGFARLIITKL